MLRIFIIASLLLSTLCNAQSNLSRKPSFGARIEFVQQDKVQGIKILQLIEGTGKSIGLQENDVVTKINKAPITNRDSFEETFRNYREGQAINLQVFRDNKTINLTGKAIGRPMETDDNASVIYDQADFRDGQLRVIINKPIKEGKMPAMLFVPGYTCNSIDNLSYSHPYKRIVDAYIDAGYVTLRIEKSGLGDSQNTPDCQSMNLNDEIENFEVGLKKLQSLPYVDKEKIIIVGHSMGGYIAPAISAKNNVAGVVVYGTGAMSWFEYQLDMYRVQNALAGMNPIEVEESVLEQYDVNYRFYVKKEPLEEMTKDPKIDSLLRNSWNYDGKGRIYDRNAEYWRQVQDNPILENWKNTTAKVLVQFGESDFQAFSRADHELVVNTVNYFNPGNAQLIVFPKTDHYFAKSGTMQEAYDKFTSGKYQQLFDDYNPEVGASAVLWSNKVIQE